MTGVSYPKLSDVQSAHRKLIQDYVGALDTVARLPFLLDFRKMLMPFEGETSFERSSRKLAPLGNLLTWRPFVALLVEMHIKSKLNELSRHYRQLALMLPDGKDFVSQREWLKEAVAECNEFNNTLAAWKNAQTLSAATLPVIAGWAGSLLGINSLPDLLNRLGLAAWSNTMTNNMPTTTWLLGWAFISLGLLFVLIYLAFHAKRAVFLPVFSIRKVETPARNLYRSEDELFNALGRRKLPELALDNIVMILFTIFGIVIAFLFLQVPALNLIWSVLIFVLLAANLVQIYYQSHARWN